MNKLTLICVAALSVCWADQRPPIPTRSVSMYDVPLTDHGSAMNDPYDLDFRVEKVGEKQFNLITNIKLKGGSFFVSPHSTQDFKGKFSVELASQKSVVLVDQFKEIPRSKEEIDPHRFVNGPVNWVSVDTRYEHTLMVTSEGDFETKGKYRFVIEPRCTLEEIPFIVKYQAGELAIEKRK